MVMTAAGRQWSSIHAISGGAEKVLMPIRARRPRDDARRAGHGLTKRPLESLPGIVRRMAPE
jgi:hypothetical protein